MTGTHYPLEVRPRVPEKLYRLQELANDLLYTWDRSVRGLFFRLDPALWEACNHNPKVFLRRVAQEKLDAALHDPIFMEDYERVLRMYEHYRARGIRSELKNKLDPDKDLIAYFCAEFGLSESLPTYSGGLGILAGDHCKAASDLGLPFVGIGLLYRQGYFTQSIDGHGRQIAHYTPVDFRDLPLTPAVDEQGKELRVEVPIEEREVRLRIWQGQAGHINLYLLDSDIEENSPADRGITYQLYGGDISMRMQQEIVLGIGGVRALRALKLAPTVWHLNEGHSAFQILERCREQMGAGHDFDTALELVAAASVFTTHTPVAAGHDRFDHGLVERFLGPYLRKHAMDIERVFGLGSAPENHGQLNMTSLALRGTRFHNGVSRIHGTVASEMEHYIWPDIPPEENPITYITNGVHVSTFLAREWANLFDGRIRGWRQRLRDPAFWECIDEIPDHRYWSMCQSLKSEMLEDINERIVRQYRRNGSSEALIKRVTRFISVHDTDALIVGFARRFATYKRATLLFSDEERLARLLNNAERPVIFIFAGKAHPQDVPGQELIRRVHQLSQDPRFVGRILLIEGYDMSLARKLVTGCDVWLNTPEYPMEASGTSGQKAGLNGVINFSVLDGWWGEGYNGRNGWAIIPHGQDFGHKERDIEEASDLIDILKKQIVPMYYNKGSKGYSEEWVHMSKASMKSILPRFNSERMVMDYVLKLYLPAIRKSRQLANDNAGPAAELAVWKNKIRKCWGSVTARRVDEAITHVYHNDSITLQVAVNLNGLSAEDVNVECQIGTMDSYSQWTAYACYQLKPEKTNEKNETLYSLTFVPNQPGQQYYQLRLSPFTHLLAHPYEMGRMIWL